MSKSWLFGVSAILIACCPWSSPADELDYSIVLRGKADPRVKGTIGGTVGYGIYLWGKGSSSTPVGRRVARATPPPPKERDWRYGFLHPSLNVDTAVLVTRLGAQLDVYPISFAGFNFGHSYTFSAIDRNEYVDCNEYQCAGTFSETFAGVKAGFGYRGLFSNAFFQTALVRSNDDTRPFTIGGAVLPTGLGGDTLFRSGGTLGYRVTSKVSAGATGTYFYMVNTVADGYTITGFTELGNRPWSYRLGTTFYESTLITMGCAVMFEIKWTGAEGLGK